MGKKIILKNIDEKIKEDVDCFYKITDKILRNIDKEIVHGLMETYVMGYKRYLEEKNDNSK